ncbi:MAG: hypothetical protein ACR2P0_17845 [Acidimicrobiales bacterium]
MSTQTFTVVSDLHRAMEFDEALAWFNGILSGDEWAVRDKVEVIADDGHRTVQWTLGGSRWTLEVDVSESRVLGGVMVSARVRDPLDGYELPELSGLARALVP